MMASAETKGVGGDIGRIEPGKLEDLSFIDGDPRQHIKDLRRGRRAMKDGLSMTTSPRSSRVVRLIR